MLVVSFHFTGFKPSERHLVMDSQLQACVTMRSAFWPISKKNGGEGDKHNSNTIKSNTLVL